MRMNENIHMLIVEDDSDISNLLKNIFQKQGYEVRCAFSGTEALMCIEHYEYQIILLDLMLPGMSGEQLIQSIRAVKIMPILVISAKNEQEVMVEVLSFGADDFISKPFDVKEVIARVEAQLRRYLIFSNAQKTSCILRCKNLLLNTETIEVTVNEKPINLTSREFSILELFLTYPSKVFTKANLFEHVWKDEYLGDENTVNVHISNLRSKIAREDPESEYIHTVWGIGFKLNDKT